MKRMLFVFLCVLGLAAPATAADELVPQRPIFGGRSISDGMIQLNPHWAKPTRELLRQAQFIVVTDRRNKSSHPLPAELQGQEAVKLLGIVIAIVEEGNVTQGRYPDDQYK